MTIEPLSTEAVERLSEWLEYRPGEGTDFASHAADLRALLQERAALREALEPFAAYPLPVNIRGEPVSDAYELTGRHIGDKFEALKAGDFRRARQALTGAKDHG